MLYLISDIHGHYNKFRTMLRKINFDRKNDHMIVMGDVLDRGPNSYKLIEYIKNYMEDGSMEILLGNHELFAARYIEGKLEKELYGDYGGKEMITIIEEMKDSEKEEFRRFIRALPYYKLIKSDFFGDTVVTHTGINANFLLANEDGSINVVKSIESGIKNDEMNSLCGKDLHYMGIGELKKLDKFLIVGHVPTSSLNEDGSNMFYRRKYFMTIDSGIGYSSDGMLGCYCVDTDDEFYV